MICRSRRTMQDHAETENLPFVLLVISATLLSAFVHDTEALDFDSDFYKSRSGRSVFESPPTCKKGLFDCQDSNGCISASWVCDGEIDCDESKLDERQSCCSEGKQFECLSDGLCVDLEFRCDSFSDCVDSSDEKNCSTCASEELFKCNSGRCVDPVFICDQDNDCGDFSDEIDCHPDHHNTYMCQNQEFRVLPEQLCDGVNDCGDMSDEIGCDPCEPFHFGCQDGEGCVLVFDLCDGEAHCYDGSDEKWCHECQRSDQFKCRNGNCVDREQVCNHVNDCEDRSDEEVCTCQPGVEFRCTSGIRDHFNASNVKCIPDEWVCDGMNDCKEGEDEKWDMCQELKELEESTEDATVDGEEENQKEEVTMCSLENEFECSDGSCIPIGQVCDGFHDCYRGEDEIGCPSTCPKGTYELCLTTTECISYDQFCDGVQDCADNSDESFTNGYCFCSGILCGSKCVPVDKICDSTWDCKHGEDEVECTKCRTNLQSTTSLTDQTIFVISLIKTTYTQMDSFQIYFAALVDQWTSFFGESESPFHMEVAAHDPDAQDLVDEAQEFLISIVSLRPTLRQFMAVMVELGLADETLPKYDHSATLNEQVRRVKRYIIERSSTSSKVYDEMIKRCEYLKQKSIDSIQTLSAITKMLHFDFSTCRDHGFYNANMQNKRSQSFERNKRSMREVFTALSLVQNDVPRDKLGEFLNKLYDLDDQLKQLIVSVQKYDEIIASVAFLIDDARERLEKLVMSNEEANVAREKRDFWTSLDTKARYSSKYGQYESYKGRK